MVCLNDYMNLEQFVLIGLLYIRQLLVCTSHDFRPWHTLLTGNEVNKLIINLQY